MDLKKRSILVAGHATSVSLEEEFWQELKSMAAARGVSINVLITQIDATRDVRNLCSALRVAVLRNYRAGGCNDR